MNKKILVGILACLFLPVVAHAQIGYQVSLLNSATGKPRANETVKAEVTITDSKNGTVCSETQSVVSNDFGILSITVGKADTFKDVAIGRLPLFVSVTVDGVLIGKSQILSVPVAEVASTLKSDFTLDELCGKEWMLYGGHYGYDVILFEKDGTCVIPNRDSGDTEWSNFNYQIEGNTIYVYYTYYWWNDNGEIGEWSNRLFVLRWVNGTLYRCS
ncbi:MAG: hypothetical protein K2H04_07675 [Bacteroidaceae bacterium]|nr:hypothetical protein [Bacteroidaceae bacterium]